MDEMINNNASFVDAEIIPHVFYQVYGMDQKWMHDDEVIYYSFNASIKEDNVETNLGHSEITVVPAAKGVEKNKYFASSAVAVTIVPGEDLAEKFPLALVSIDGKTYDLSVLSNPITFNMDKDHRISIHWVAGEIVETFRICVNR